MKKLSFTLLLASLALAQDTPQTMNRITVQLDGSEVPQNNFGRKPKTIYRAGSTYCRVEEAPDPEHNIRGLLIVNEPNAWMVNLATKTAPHAPCRASLNIRLVGKPSKTIFFQRSGLVESTLTIGA